MSYHTLCARANSRTFHLIKKMRDSGIVDDSGDDIIREELAANPILDITGNVNGSFVSDRI